MGLREWIVPQEHLFFDLFEKEVDVSVKAAAFLRESVRTLNDPQKMARDLKEMEKESDEIVHTVYVTMNKSFITPLDQGDIGYMASTIDDIVDHIEAAATRIFLYKIRKPDRFFTGMAEALVVQTRELQAAVRLLRSREKYAELQKHLIEVHRQENVADDLQREAPSTGFG